MTPVQQYARDLQASIVWRLGADRPWYVALGLSLSLAGFAAAGVAPPRRPSGRCPDGTVKGLR